MLGNNFQHFHDGFIIQSLPNRKYNCHSILNDVFVLLIVNYLYLCFVDSFYMIYRL